MEFAEMVSVASDQYEAETGNSEQNQDIPEQSPINIEEVNTTSASTERGEPSMSQVYWDMNGVWEFWGGCWWKQTSTGWWEKWGDTAGQQ